MAPADAAPLKRHHFFMIGGCAITIVGLASGCNSSLVRGGDHEGGAADALVTASDGMSAGDTALVQDATTVMRDGSAGVSDGAIVTMRDGSSSIGPDGS